MLTCNQCSKPLLLEEISINEDDVFELYHCANCEHKVYLEIDFRTNTKTITEKIS